jgi:hypothetical protein
MAAAPTKGNIHTSQALIASPSKPKVASTIWFSQPPL